MVFGLEGPAARDPRALVCLSARARIPRPPAKIDYFISVDGTGLGLPIAKALVQLHGGALAIRSERARGTEVTVRLPSRFDVSQVGSWESPDGQKHYRTEVIARQITFLDRQAAGPLGDEKPEDGGGQDIAPDDINWNKG